LAFCTIVPRPKDLGDGVYGFVPMMGLSLTYDHQALDGGEATLFLKEIKETDRKFDNLKRVDRLSIIDNRSKLGSV
jgi:pyruvate/2-oxoglutarate dehydrogenase complex dihydrolipoamide acyltransferase (E2) component